ncbi:MAG: hypothetical protein ACQCXQ_09155 [Verrucomicrobiales bacterium]|nr:hypothetical protein [Verrucomicrobiota bacterium JB025]
MPKDPKPVKLKTVDEEIEQPKPVFRLHNAATDSTPKPVKLNPTAKSADPDEPTEVSQRLTVPTKKDVDLRSQEPDIESLIEPDASDNEALEENWGNQDHAKRPVPWGWFILLLIAIIGALIWSIGKLGEAEKQADLIREETVTTLIDEEREVREATELVKNLESATTSYFAAATPDDLLPCVRHPERVAPLIADHYSRHPFQPFKLVRISSLKPFTLENQGNFWLAKVETENAGDQQIIIEVMEHGPPLIDWETHTCYQPMNWDDYVTNRPGGTTLDFRIYLKPDNFYSHEFANSADLLCCKLTTRDSDAHLFGYMHADSQVASELKQLVHKNNSAKTAAILRLRLPENTMSRSGVWIEKLLAPRWIFVTPPDIQP